MNFVSKFDGGLPSFTGTHPKAQAHVDTVHTKAPADAILVKDADLLFNGDFKRSGSDLVISKDGREQVLSDYFKGDKHSPLASPDGAYLTGKIVDALTGHVQVAQAAGGAGAAKIIGHVTKLTGEATVIRNGVSIILNNGDNVHQGDVVQCGANSTLGITFIDGSVFGLGSNAKMVLNEMVYDPNGSNNSSLMSLVAGTISFVAGATAKHGDMKVDTPVATMGIRGTAVLVEIDFEVTVPGSAPPARFQVLVEPDGTTGSYVLLDRVTLAPIATVNQAGTVTTVSGQGTVSFLASAQLSPEAMKLISEVFSQRFTDNSNPKSDTHFTDTVIPQNTFPVKFADGGTGTATITVTAAQEKTSAPASVLSSKDHIPGEPAAVTFSKLLDERLDLTHSQQSDTISGGVSYADPNEGDIPTVSTAFSHFTFQNGAGQNITAALSTAQKGAVAAVSVPLTVVQDAAGKNFGTATWTYNVPDHALDFLADGEKLTLTYIARIDNNFALNNEFALVPFTITITGTNDKPTIVADHTTAAGAVIEDSNFNEDGNLTAGGTVTFNDVDLTDTHTATVVLKSSDASADLPGFDEGEGPDAAHIGTFALVPISEVAGDGDTAGTVGWTFTLDDDDPVLQSLAAGQTITQVYTITVSDGHGGTVTQDVTITITGSNDSPNHAPIIVGELTDATGAVTEDTNVNHLTNAISDGGTIVFKDIDLIDKHTASFEPKSSTSAAHLPGFTDNTDYIGTFDLAPVSENNGDTNPIGSVGWTFTLNDGNTFLQSLAKGQTITQVYTVTISDGHPGGTVTQDVTVTITGINDIPVVYATDNSFFERSSSTGSPDNDTTSGTIGFTDVDLIDTHDVTVMDVVASGVKTGVPDYQTIFDWLSLSAPTDSTGGVTGSRNWTFTAQDHYFDYLADGEQLVLTYTVRVDDHNGGKVDTPVTVTVKGTNDAPELAVDISGNGGLHAIAEKPGVTNSSYGHTASGSLTFADVDLSDMHTVGKSAPVFNWVNSHSQTQTLSTTQITALTTASTFTPTLHDSTGTGHGSIDFTYSAQDHYFDFLAEGETLTITYNVTVEDKLHVTSTQPVTITVTGANDTPVATAAVASVDEDASVSGTVSGTDADSGETATLIYALVNAPTTGLTFNPDGSYSFDAGSYDSLPQGQQLVLTIPFTATDVHTATSAPANLVITITGTNDTPVATAAVAAVHEDASVSGTVSGTDADSGETATLTYALVNAAPTGLTFNANGSYSFDAASYDSLPQGLELVLTIPFTATDVHNATSAPANLVITITGTNDTPSIVSETNPPTHGVMVVNPVSPNVEVAGKNTPTLNLALETFNDEDQGYASNNGYGTGTFYSDELHAHFVASGHAGIVRGSSSVTAAPFMGPLPGSADTTKYLSIGAGATETITFDSAKNAFGLYWGSVDDYNTIKFYNGGTLVASYTGADISPLLATGNQGSFAANGYVDFVGLPFFTKVELRSTSNAFEIDNIAAGVVPTSHAKLVGTVSGTMSVHDPDIGDTLTGLVAEKATVLYNNSATLPNGVSVGDLIKASNISFDSVQSDGGTDILHWNFDPHGANLDFLKAGDVLKLTYTAQVTDGHGGAGSQQLVVTLVGTDNETNISSFKFVDGTSANDTFNNVGGGTTVYGNGGNDNFVFKPGSGSATIADFDPATDTITFASSMFNHNADNVLNATNDDHHGNTVITINATDTITLQHVVKAQLSAADFHFV